MVAGRPSRVERFRFEQAADLPQGPGQLGIGLAADQGRPRVGVIEAHDHPHGGRLARPVWPQETGDHTGRDLEGEVVYSHRCAVALGE